MDSTEQLTGTPLTTEPPSERASRRLDPVNDHVPLSRSRSIFLICTLNATVLVGAMNTGIMTVGLPRITVDLGIPESLQLWPALVYSLASGCTLLLAGAVADVVGNRVINLAGTFFLGAFILASGLAKTGIALIMFRASQGIGVAMCFPTAVSILSTAFPGGRVRNIAFGCLGLGTPLGFAIGILLEGCFESVGVGWRPGFYLCAAVTMTLFAVNAWFLPRDQRDEKIDWSRMRTDVDWIGVIISSTSMALLSYSLSVMAGNPSGILEPANVLLLVISVAMIPLFVIWMNAQEARGKPALIPNSVWKNATFTAICIMVLLSWATLQSLEWFISLFYQRVQHLSAIDTAIRYLPNVIAGSVLNIVTGLLIHCVPVNYYVVVISAICASSSLLMALINPAWPWWWCAFWAMLFLPISVDVNFTVATLIITDIFPAETQALAGAVYQTVAQLGISTSIAIMAVISNAVTDRSQFGDKDSPEALMKGFRAVFWACLAMMVVSTLAGMWGLRGVKRIGTGEQHRSTEDAVKDPRLVIRRYDRKASFKAKGAKSKVASPSPELPPFDISFLPNILASLGLESEVSVDAIVDLYGGSMVSLGDQYSIIEDNA